MVDTVHEFVLSDGQTYTLTPITVRDWSAFCRYLNGRDGLPPDRRVSFDAMTDASQSLDGALWLVHRSMQAHHKGTSFDQVQSLIPDIIRLAEIASIVTAPPEPDEKANPPRAEEAKPT